MSVGEAASVLGLIVAFLVVCSLPGLACLPRSGPRYRAAVWRQLAFAWAVAALVVGWLALGFFAIEAGPRWFHPYRDFTLVLMGAAAPLLFLGVRAGNRAAAAAQLADRVPPPPEAA